MVKARREETAALEGVEDSALLEPVPVLLVRMLPVKAVLIPEAEVDNEVVTGSNWEVLKKKLVRISYRFKVNKLTWTAYWCLYQLQFQ